MAKFTEGPWVRGSYGGFFSINENRKPVPHSSCWKEEAWSGTDVTEESIANDYLMSAAPDMYKALKEMIEEAEDMRVGDNCDHDVNVCWCEYFRRLTQAQQALTKAEGRRGDD